MWYGCEQRSVQGQCQNIFDFRYFSRIIFSWSPDNHQSSANLNFLKFGTIFTVLGIPPLSTTLLSTTPVSSWTLVWSWPPVSCPRFTFVCLSDTDSCHWCHRPVETFLFATCHWHCAEPWGANDISNVCKKIWNGTNDSFFKTWS